MKKRRLFVSSLDKVLKITLLLGNKILVKRDLNIHLIDEGKTLSGEYEVIIEDEKITKIILDEKKLENDFSKEEIKNIEKELQFFIGKVKNIILNSVEYLNTKEICNLENLKHVSSDSEKHFYINDEHEKLTFGYLISKETNDVYLSLVKVKNIDKPIFINPKMLISKEIIKQNKKFRLKHLFKNYK